MMAVGFWYGRGSFNKVVQLVNRTWLLNTTASSSFLNTGGNNIGTSRSRDRTHQHRTVASSHLERTVWDSYLVPLIAFLQGDDG